MENKRKFDWLDCLYWFGCGLLFGGLLATLIQAYIFP